MGTHNTGIHNKCLREDMHAATGTKMRTAIGRADEGQIPDLSCLEERVVSFARNVLKSKRR